MSDTNITINISGAEIDGKLIAQLISKEADKLKSIPKNEGSCNFKWVRVSLDDSNPFTITKEQYDKDVEQAKNDAKAGIINIFYQDLLGEILHGSSINHSAIRAINRDGHEIVRGEIRLDLLLDAIKNLIKS